ncbi:MAG: FxsA family protein [Verrucomicrobiae bacterium]|nr:FxsA family protein [Verrucomicrobiae bacterium]
MFAKLLVIFIGIPLIELYLFLLIGQKIGVLPTVATVVLTGFLGAWLTKQQGLKTLARYQQTLSEGKMPHTEVIEGIMILAAGAVLLTPGFLTDALGFFLLIPPARAWVRQRLSNHLQARVQVATETAANRAASKDRSVIEIEAEVIDERDRNQP